MLYWKCTMRVRKFKRRYIVRLISTLQYCFKWRSRHSLLLSDPVSKEQTTIFMSQEISCKKTANLCTHGVTFFSGRMHSRVRGAYFDDRFQMKLLFAVWDWSVGMWTNTWHVANNAWHAPRYFSWIMRCHFFVDYKLHFRRKPYCLGSARGKRNTLMRKLAALI